MIVQPKEIKNIKIHPGQTVGLTSGCFDLPHFYHLQYLQRCAAQCDVLIVGVDADDLIVSQKGRAPAMPEHQRTAMIAALRCVDAVFTLRNLKDLTLAGQTANYLFKNNPTIYGQPIIGAETAKLIIIPDIQEIQSTTELKQKIKNTQEQHQPKNQPNCGNCNDTKIAISLDGTQEDCPNCCIQKHPHQTNKPQEPETHICTNPICNPKTIGPQTTNLYHDPTITAQNLYKAATLGQPTTYNGLTFNQGLTLNPQPINQLKHNPCPTCGK